ncbi:MAG TPA: pyruvate kinase [Longimicrobium sp.]|nr:pyruvate kinase [Longimicrobium sp.]
MSAQLLSAPPLPAASRTELDSALEALEDVRRDLLDRERRFEPVLAELPPAARPSARNLVHYLGLRAHDLEPLQRVLAAHGLSSLGRAEPHVLATLDAVLRALRALTGRRDSAERGESSAAAFARAERTTRERADALFGPAPAGRPVRVMATMPAEAANDPALVRDLLAGGMDCMRINCAHDGPEAWAGMVENLRRARAEVGRPCAVLMDLPGPRVRTGGIEPGPRVVKLRPERDELGRVVRPARAWLTSAENPAPAPGPADAVLPLPAELVARLGPGDRLRFRDARGARRRLRVADRAEGGAWAETGKTAYVVTGTEMRLRLRAAWVPDAEGVVGDLPPLPRKIPLRPGDALVLTVETTPGRAAVLDEAGAVVVPARIPVAPPEALRGVRPGARVWLDDGRIGGVVASIDGEGVRVGITRVLGSGKLGAEKGVNFPGTDLGLPALTDEDLRILPFVREHAELVGYSFARDAEGVRRLREELERAGAPELGIVLKIETTAAFQGLPMMLLEALRCRAAGVMIARGDLAVEVGFERLAEVQEEILWMCEAAHVPVVWATQVLEQLTREGAPSRAEVSDAALGERAECVMLNKGPYLPEAVRALDDILARMHRHQEKKRPLLAHLGVADHFFAQAPPTPAGSAAADGPRA